MITENQLKEILTPHLPENFVEHYLYSVLPAGKLFRPHLVQAIVNDLSLTTKGHDLIAAAIETHHVYTLIHDDLPAMDDDDMRRGRLASHKKYNEWMAILLGDGLLCSSYSILAQVQNQYSTEMIQYFSKCVGPQGLILGQMLDLGDQEKDFDEIIKIHTLKTARLFRCCLVLPLIIAGKSELKEEFEQLSDSLGILFQLKDDYDDFHSQSESIHEKEINPYSQFGESFVNEYFNKQKNICSEILKRRSLPEISKIYYRYFA